MLGALWVVLRQPGFEQLLQFVRQAQDHVARMAGAGGMGGFEDGFHVAVVDHGDDGRGHHAHGNAGVGELFHHVEPPLRRRGAGFQAPVQFAIQRGDGDVNAGEVVLGQPAEDVDVPFHQPGFRDEAHGVLEFLEHLQQLPGDFPFPLDGLVGIGVGADHDGLRLVARIHELAS